MPQISHVWLRRQEQLVRMSTVALGRLVVCRHFKMGLNAPKNTLTDGFVVICKFIAGINVYRVLSKYALLIYCHCSRIAVWLYWHIDLLFYCKVIFTPPQPPRTRRHLGGILPFQPETDTCVPEVQ